MQVYNDAGDIIKMELMKILKGEYVDVHTSMLKWIYYKMR